MLAHNPLGFGFPVAATASHSVVVVPEASLEEVDQQERSNKKVKRTNSHAGESTESLGSEDRLFPVEPRRKDSYRSMLIGPSLEAAMEDVVLDDLEGVCVEVDLTKPLLSKFHMHRKVWRLVYEGLSNVYFMCGHYGQSLENCHINPDPDAPSKMDMQAAEEENTVGAHDEATGGPNVVSGSRFASLSAFQVEEVVTPEGQSLVRPSIVVLPVHSPSSQVASPRSNKGKASMDIVVAPPGSTGSIVVQVSDASHGVVSKRSDFVIRGSGSAASSLSLGPVVMQELPSKMSHPVDSPLSPVIINSSILLQNRSMCPLQVEFPLLHTRPLFFLLITLRSHRIGFLDPTNWMLPQDQGYLGWVFLMIRLWRMLRVAIILVSRSYRPLKLLDLVLHMEFGVSSFIHIFMRTLYWNVHGASSIAIKNAIRDLR
ncbi:hypothetical protein Tsubulata_003002 [Turnera subulata]|uniref:DUF4283 domain-containing protein n=1 Tax=Turnera subulata TaxID=218843 RepID=A0A9Q0G3K9_9ROSI|nr:hypothetical protein Tsubulata_003002 [Turnera subulata]